MTETIIPASGALRSTFERRLPDRVIWPDDERYAAARQLWNAAIDHRPAAIVRPQSAREVATAILAAREVDAEIAVRSGGHSVPGHSMADGGVTIELSALNHVAVDAGSRTARVGAGSLLMDVANAASPSALAMPFGHVSHTGIGGFTLGGGIGWVMRKYGLAIDSLRSAALVTADGELVRASADENPDLFWALRGGGGNFGVVTEFEFDLHPFGPEVLAGFLVYPLDEAAEALRFSRDFMDLAPAELTVYETFMTAPPHEPFPVELQGRPALGIALVYAGRIPEAEAVLEPLRRGTSPALELLGPMPYPAVQTMLDAASPHGMRNYNKSHWLRELPDEAVDGLVARHAGVPSPMSLIITSRVGGAVAEVDPDATAFAHRDAYRLLWVVSSWWEGDDEEQIAWCRDVFDATEPYSSGGVYVNALGDEGESRVRASYGDDAWARLVEAKRRWDPDNVFHLNQNIAPS